MLVKPAGRLRLDSAVQFRKAELPMPVTLLGSVTLARLLQPENVESLMTATPSGITKFASLLHPLIAELPTIAIVTGSHIAVFPIDKGRQFFQTPCPQKNDLFVLR